MARQKSGLHVADFDKEVKYISKQLKLKTSQLMRWTALSVFEKVIKASPVDTGVFRASWVLGVNCVPPDPKIPKPPKKKGTPIPPPQAGQTSGKLSTVQLGDTIIIANHLPYARVLEYGEFPGQGPKTTARGYSTQAPQGVVRVSVQQVARQLRKKKL